MRFSLRSVRVLSVAALVVAPVLSTRDAFGGSSSVVVPLACTSTFGSNAGHITLDASVPDNVPPGSAFAFDVTARDFFDIPAPYSGTLSLQLTFAASSGATPSGNFVVSAPAVHFDQGDFMPVLGVFHEQFVASGAPGSTITFSFVQFDYTIVPDPGPQSLDFACTPTPTAPVIAQTLVSTECLGAAPTIVGTPGDDAITGTSGNDVIDAGAGNDTITGLSGRDRVAGGGGDDVIAGNSGDDELSGDAGNDVLSGNSGRDHLDGGADVGAPGDSCDGGSGIDTAIACEVVLATP